jgi:predicted GIY-YIG superfamily endonuclease
MPYVVYILEGSDDTYYTGTASDLSQRLLQHEQGAVHSSYTYSHRPVKLVWTSEETEHYSEALRWERQIKGWSRAKKKALIRNDFDAVHGIVKEERKRKDLNKKEFRAERRNSVLLFSSRSVNNLETLSCNESCPSTSLVAAIAPHSAQDEMQK